MAAKGSFPPIEEQLKSVNMVMRIASQPLVHDFILRYAEQHLGTRNGASPSRESAPHSESRSGPPITLTESVRKILPLLAIKFNYQAVIERLSEEGYEFTATDQRTAIGRVFHRLKKEGLISEVTKGKGGTPSVYKRL
jgi:hypothetical protein